MFLKRLTRRNTKNVMTIGDGIKLTVSEMAGEDVRSPNDLTLEIGGDYLPPGVPKLVVRFERLTGMKPTISVDAPREIPIRHESCGPLPDTD